MWGLKKGEEFTGSNLEGVKNECVDAWMGGWIGVWMDACVDGWMGGWVDGWVERWMLAK